ncbi:hypothetical protein LV75_000769 [Actinokineospora diospyrosa]|uniref:Uncharacterized protein n=1 Tax=Actinokineospora diospyrosa TaxID=103728 RepID=A0ABT1I6N2_9PSEU|nr:hypothetical protein [Actinokineospora diospyrosa]
MPSRPLDSDHSAGALLLVPSQPPSGPAPLNTWLARGHSDPVVPAQPRQVRPSHWLLGPGGVSPPSVRSAPTRLPSPGHSERPVSSQPALVGPANSAHGQSDPSVPTRLPSGPPQPTFPARGQSESLVPGARWGGPVLCGGTAAVASFSGRAGFWAPALRFCVGCCRGPAQNRSTASSFSHCRVSRRCCRQATRRLPEPKAEARISCPASPARAYVKINPIESPQIHSLPRTTDTTGAPNDALWTHGTVVDNHNQPHKIIRHKRPQYTAYRRSPTNGSSEQQPVDNRRRCGQQETLWTAEDVWTAETCGQSEALWTNATTPTPRNRNATPGVQGDLRRRVAVSYIQARSRTSCRRSGAVASVGKTAAT